MVEYFQLSGNVVANKKECPFKGDQGISLAVRLMGSDLCISDLDRQMIWYNVAEQIAFKKIGVDSLVDEIKYIIWGLEGLSDLHRAIRQKSSPEKIKKVKENNWLKYHQEFLRDPYNSLDGMSESLKISVVEKIDDMLTPKEVRKSIFPGLEELHKTLPAKNVLISRNVEPVLQAYQKELGFSYVADSFDKVSALKDILDKNQEYRRIIIRGDDIAEVKMVKYAQKLKQEGRLDDVIPILRTSHDNLFGNDLSDFTFRVGSNDYGLLYLLNRLGKGDYQRPWKEFK